MADPKIKYDIEAIVSGSADVLALANNIEKLSSGFDGEIKEKALSTAASLRELSRQDSLLQAFGELRNSLIDTSFKLSAARQSIKDLDGVMSLAGKSTREQEGAMQKLKDTAKQLENEFGTQSVAVEKYSKELALAGIKANDFVNAQVRVKNSLSSIKAEAATMASVLSGVGDGAVKSGQKLQEAFGVLGVKSAETLKAEIASVRGAMETVSNASAKTGASLAGAFNAGNQKIKDLERDLRSLNGTLTLSDRAASLFSQSIRHVALGNVVADGVGYLAGKVKQLASAFVETIVHTEQFRKGMTAVYKDTALAEKQFDFLKKTANSAGVSINAIQADFLRFSAAFKNANIPLAQTNELFSTLVHVGSTLGLSNEQVAGTLNALGQMASKGVVSMEELRQQLGDRLPGALAATARGMGITEATLIKMVSSGDLATRNFVVPFTNGIREMEASAVGIVPTFSRIGNALTLFAQSIGDAGGTQILAGALKLLGAAAGAVVVPLAALAEGLFFAGKAVVGFYGMVRGDKDALKYLAEEAEKTTGRLGKLSSAFASIGNESGNTKRDIIPLSDALKGLSINGKDLDDKLSGATNSEKAFALSAKIAASSTLDKSAKIIQLATNLGHLAESQKQVVDNSKKYVASAKQEGDTLVKLAELSGKEAQINAAKIEAATLLLNATTQSVKAHQEELTIAELLLKSKIDDAVASGAKEEQVKSETATLADKVTAMKSELEQSVQAEAAAKQQLVTSRALLEAYKDNSGSLAVYRDALKMTQDTLRQYESQAAQGKRTQEEVNGVKQEAARLQNLINDAVKDSVANLDRETRAKQASLGVETAKLSAEQSSHEIKARLARASGDYSLALHHEIEAKNAQIKGIELAANLKRLEADADAKRIEIERQAIPIDDAMRAAKLDELDIRSKMVEIKRIEAGASLEVVKAIQSEIAAMRNLNNEKRNSPSSAGSGAGNSSGNSGGGSGSGSGGGNSRGGSDRRNEDRNTGAGGNNDPYDRPGNDNDRFGRPQAGSSLSESARANLPGNGANDMSFQFALRDKLVAGKLTAEDIKDLDHLTKVMRGNEAIDRSATASKSFEGMRDTAYWQKIREDMEAASAKLKAGIAAQNAANEAPQTTETQAAKTPSAAGGRVININIGGNRFPVRTDAQGAQNLVTALQIGARNAGM